ncbi:MmcQ/YjbR family DNA-binding protein [Candidatus Saccharibacteria bacterium]|nr:MmcQ/YjbR family DNA-binding protein [Candidatus Saccharibacteria bacterium]
MSNQNVYHGRQTKDIVAHIREHYEVEPEFLWEKYPGFCIFRNTHNRKWFALLARITARQLGLERDGYVEILNLRFDRGGAPDLVATRKNFFPAYHMNKNNWLTVLLDGKMKDEEIFELIENSYVLIGVGE